MPLPAPQPYRRMAPNQSHCAACHAETVLSKAAVPSLPLLQRVSRRVLHRPAHRPRKQPSHQIAIGGYPTTPRGFLPWRLSDAGPQGQLINREWAGIRNPSHPLPCHRGIGMVRCGPDSGPRAPCPDRRRCADSGPLVSILVVPDAASRRSQKAGAPPCPGPDFGTSQVHVADTRADC
jgi:hypothetical protein